MEQPQTKYRINKPLTEQDVKKLNEIAKNSNGNLMIMMDNTKGQSKDILAMLDPSIKVNVFSGKDYTKDSDKFLNSIFDNATVYSPAEISQIVGIFESMEAKIPETFTPRQKAMTMYKLLSENLHYERLNESSIINDNHVSNSLRGLIYKRGVWVGFSTIFKESMDRMGVESSYVRGGGHAWNTITLDGKNYIVDLTHENRSAKCNFNHFGTNKNENRSKKNPTYPEGIEFSEFSQDELSADAKIIESELEKQKNFYSVQNGREFSFEKIRTNDNADTYLVVTNKNITGCLHLKPGTSVDNYSPEQIISAIRNGNILGSDNAQAPETRVCRRKQGQNFVIIKNNKTQENGDIGTYEYYDVEKSAGGSSIRSTEVACEHELTSPEAISSGQLKTMFYDNNRLRYNAISLARVVVRSVKGQDKLNTATGKKVSASKRYIESNEIENALKDGVEFEM